MSFRADESGFAAAEAALAIAALSIIGGIALGFAASGLGALARSREASNAAATLLRAEAALRDSACLVRIPYWQRYPDLIFAAGRASAPFFRGDPSSRLEIAWDDRSLILSRGGPADQLRLAPIRVLGAAPLLAPSGEIEGLRVEVAVAGKRCAISAPFGQGPLRSDYERRGVVP